MSCEHDDFRSHHRFLLEEWIYWGIDSNAFIRSRSMCRYFTPGWAETTYWVPENGDKSIERQLLHCCNDNNILGTSSRGEAVSRFGIMGRQCGPSLLLANGMKGG
jgi:hypothetical protein